MSKFRFLCLGLVATFLTVLPVSAAERIVFNFGPLGFSVSVASLETFAKEGKINKDLAFFLNRLSPQQQAQFRKFLQSRYQVNPRVIYRFSQSSVGEALLKDVGELINIPQNQNGFYGLRGSLVQAVLEHKSINILELFRKFPTDMQLNTENIMEFVRQTSSLIQETKTLVAQLDRITTEASRLEVANKSLSDLTKIGSFKTSMQTIELYDSKRDRKLLLDLYLPQTTNTSIPVIVVSNGIGAGRARFDDLAKHLASYGFAIAIPDHPGSDYRRQQEFYQGLHQDNFDATEFRDRPLDISFLLDELEKRNSSQFNNRLNLQQVGVFGYSFGGATALSLAGAQFNYQKLEKDCTTQNRLLNISLYYQCRVLELPRQQDNLQDNRIKAVYLFVPFSNSLFGQGGMKSVNTPVMWQAAAEDIITPLFSEQMPAFADLSHSDKYFAVSTGLPHAWILLPLLQGFSKQEISKENATSIARDYQNVLTVAFFKTYLAKEEEYRSYLQASYIKALSENPFNLSLVQSVKDIKQESQ